MSINQCHIEIRKWIRKKTAGINLASSQISLLNLSSHSLSPEANVPLSVISPYDWFTVAQANHITCDATLRWELIECKAKLCSSSHWMCT